VSGKIRDASGGLVEPVVGQSVKYGQGNRHA